MICLYKVVAYFVFFLSNKSDAAENLRREHLETFKGLLWSAKAKNIEAPPWPWSSDQGLAKVWPQWSAFLFLHCKYLQVLTNIWLLVDSGATCTILPATSCKDPVLNPSVKLQAVNETQLDTFGTQLVKNHIGDSVYTHCQNHHCQHKNSYFGLGLSDCPPFWPTFDLFCG